VEMAAHHVLIAFHGCTGCWTDLEDSPKLVSALIEEIIGEVVRTYEAEVTHALSAVLRE